MCSLIDTNVFNNFYQYGIIPVPAMVASAFLLSFKPSPGRICWVKRIHITYKYKFSLSFCFFDLKVNWNTFLSYLKNLLQGQCIEAYAILSF